MTSMKKILLLLLLLSLSSALEAQKLKCTPLFLDLKIDSMVVTMLPENLFFNKNVTRDSFDSNKQCVERIISDCVQIDLFIKEISNLDVDSILPYRGDEIHKRMIIYKNPRGKYYTFWINDDDLDIRCRVLCYIKESIIVLWLSDTGVCDVDVYRCSGGNTVIKYLRSLV